MTGVQGERMIDSLRFPADHSQHRPLSPRQPVDTAAAEDPADIAAAAVEPPTPILPSAMRSTPSVTASVPNAMVARNLARPARRHGEIGSRQVKAEVVELQPEAVGGANLVDSRAPAAASSTKRCVPQRGAARRHGAAIP